MEDRDEFTEANERGMPQAIGAPKTHSTLRRHQIVVPKNLLAVAETAGTAHADALDRRYFINDA